MTTTAEPLPRSAPPFEPGRSPLRAHRQVRIVRLRALEDRLWESVALYATRMGLNQITWDEYVAHETRLHVRIFQGVLPALRELGVRV